MCRLEQQPVVHVGSCTEAEQTMHRLLALLEETRGTQEGVSQRKGRGWALLLHSLVILFQLLTLFSILYFPITIFLQYSKLILFSHYYFTLFLNALLFTLNSVLIQFRFITSQLVYWCPLTSLTYDTLSFIIIMEQDCI